MDWTVATYLLYLLIAIPLTVWVAGTLSRHGRVFLEDVFDSSGGERLAHAVNRLLVVGFYLVNLGFVSLYLRSDAEVVGMRGALEQLSVKIGVVTLVRGVLHFANVWVFSAWRRRQRMDSFRSAPVAPQGYVAPYAPPTAYPAPGR